MLPRCVALATAWLACTACVDAIATRDVGQAIVGGTPTLGDPSVVALYAETTYDGARVPIVCSGTLIAPRVVLTAAHCLDRIETPDVHLAYFGSDVTAFLAGDDLKYMAAIDVVAFDYNRAFVAEPAEALHDGNDIGLVRLASDAPVVPIAIGRTALETLEGIAIRIVGFGSDGSLDGDTGIKREATAVIDRISDGLVYYGSPAPGRAYANTCAGDSGGPLLLDVGGRELVVGITSFGDAACQQYGAATRVDRYADTLIRSFVGAGPVCAADGRCESGCGVPDPDCTGGDDDVRYGTISGGCGAAVASPSPLAALVLVACLALRTNRRRRTPRRPAPP